MLNRLYTRQLFTFPAEEGKTTTVVPDMAEEIPTTDNGGISSDGKTYTIKMRDGHQVEHLAVPPGDCRRLRPRREAHLQPDPAVRWVDELHHPDRGHGEVLR